MAIGVFSCQINNIEKYEYEPITSRSNCVFVTFHVLKYCMFVDFRKMRCKFHVTFKFSCDFRWNPRIWTYFCRVLTITLLFLSAKSMHFRWFSRFWWFLLGSSTGIFAKWLSFGAFVVCLCDFYVFSTFRSVVGAF